LKVKVDHNQFVILIKNQYASDCTRL